MCVKRGEIYKILFDDAKGSEQGDWRYAVVIQNETGNKYSPTTIVAALTAQKSKAKLPVHINLTPTKENGLIKESTVLLEQVRTFDIDKRFEEKVGKLNEMEMEKIDRALAISMGLN